MLLWWSPDPRAILPLDGLHVSRRLARTLRQGRFRVTLNAAFVEVIAALCGARGDVDHAGRSVRPTCGCTRSAGPTAWRCGADGGLAGGLYGVAVGGLFAAESMFHRVRDASKVAVVALVEHARRAGSTLIDVQMPSAHLASLGVLAIPRADYLRPAGRRAALRAPGLRLFIYPVESHVRRLLLALLALTSRPRRHGRPPRPPRSPSHRRRSTTWCVAGGRLRQDQRPQGRVHPDGVQQEPEPEHSRPGDGLSQEGRQAALGVRRPDAPGDRLRRQDALGLHADPQPGERGPGSGGAGRPGRARSWPGSAGCASTSPCAS